MLKIRVISTIFVVSLSIAAIGCSSKNTDPAFEHAKAIEMTDSQIVLNSQSLCSIDVENVTMDIDLSKDPIYHITYQSYECYFSSATFNFKQYWQQYEYSPCVIGCIQNSNNNEESTTFIIVYSNVSGTFFFWEGDSNSDYFYSSSIEATQIRESHLCYRYYTLYNDYRNNGSLNAQDITKYIGDTYA